jgi:hypothetical protein
MEREKVVSAAIRQEAEQFRKEQSRVMADATNTLSEFLIFTVGTVMVIYMGFRYQEMAKDIERSFFTLSDRCGEKEIEQNSSNYEYGLESLRILGEVPVPTAVHLDSVDFEDPQSWILNGDSITKVGGNYWYVAVDTDMSGISGEMLRRRFETVNCSDMYRWWHPKDHEYGVWLTDETYEPSTSLVARQGKIHRVKERIGGKMNKLDIFFHDPCVGKDCEELKTQGVELILSGKVHAHLTLTGRVYAGFFIHTLRVDDTGSTLHSRFTMGKDVHCLDNPNSWTCFLFDTFRWFIKKIMLSEKNAGAMFTHCKEEMFTLGRLLAKLNNVAVRS